MRTELVVIGHDRPVVIEGMYVRAALGDHRLDCEGHAGAELRALPLHRIVHDIRVHMDLMADAVSAVVLDDAVAQIFRLGADRRADIIKIIPRNRLFNPCKEAGLCALDDAFCVIRAFADAPGSRSIRMISVIICTDIQRYDIAVL